MNRILSFVLIISIICFSVQNNFSQTSQNIVAKNRPKIGLVLSGGGARGLAHIGVLKVLEENRIPVDFIGGASMGALVGAMYAMGKTPDEMEQLVRGLSWEKYFSSGTTFENLSFRRKEDKRNIPSPITLRGRANNLKLPNALNSGHEIGLLLDKLTLPYAKTNDFENLPIPFRCVATDMTTGESVTLKSGSLSQSLRASMSIPGVFAPVEINGKILSDGGLVNNIPTNLVKDMGADIVLVVNIETQLGSRESLDNLLGVLAQTINIATADNSRRSLRQADFIIAPNLEGFTSASFDDSGKIIAIGYEGANEKKSLLQSLSLSESEWQAHLEDRKKRESPDEIFIPQFVAAEAKNPNSAKTIEERLNDKYTNQPLDDKKQDELAQDLSQLVGTGRFSSLNYGIKKRNGQTGLIIQTNENQKLNRTPTRLELGFDVNSVETDNVNFNFIARMTIFDLGRYGTELRNDIVLGSNILLASEYYRPLGDSKYFIAPAVSYSRGKVNFFENGRRSSEYVVQKYQAGVDVGYSFNQRTEFRAGYAIGYEKASLRIGDSVLPNFKGAFSRAGARLNYDGLNESQVPTDGLMSRNSINYFFNSPDAENKYLQFETRNMTFRKISQRQILFGFANAGATFGGTAPLLQKFTLGGPFRLSGYGYEEFRAGNYMQGGIGLLYNPINFSSFLGGKVYVGGWYEAGSAFERFKEFNYRQSISGGTIIETPLGPVFLGGSLNEKGKGRIYFSFGRIFRFNRTDSF